MLQAGVCQILIAEDDKKLRETLTDFLTSIGYHVLAARDGQECLELFYNHNRTIDLVLLDVMMPLIDGFEVLRELRKGTDVPVIMLTARETEEDQLHGLGLGADNYLTKPFSLRVLKAHIETQLKRVLRHEQETLVKGCLTVEKETHRVVVDSRVLDLTPKEYDLLLFLMEHEQVIFTRDQILDSVWGYDYDGDMRTVDSMVKQLRKKLTGRYPYICSVYGVGYKFEVPNEANQD